MDLHELVNYCDERLNVDAFDDYCPNGLQVEAGAEVKVVVSGVTASLALIERAAELNADLLLVHHGYFWKGEPAPLTGMKGQRIRSLLGNNISLLAYHLPLDAHPELGNNAGLGRVLGFVGQPLREGALVWGAELSKSLTCEQLSTRLSDVLQRSPLVLQGHDRPLHRVAWCTGAAQGYIGEAAAAGYDAFISGEVSEQTLHQARELDIAYFAAGHHATERFGARSLGEELAKQFDLRHQFVDIVNPV